MAHHVYCEDDLRLYQHAAAVYRGEAAKAAAADASRLDGSPRAQDAAHTFAAEAAALPLPLSIGELPFKAVGDGAICITLPSMAQGEFIRVAITVVPKQVAGRRSSSSAAAASQGGAAASSGAASASVLHASEATFQPLSFSACALPLDPYAIIKKAGLQASSSPPPPLSAFADAPIQHPPLSHIMRAHVTIEALAPSPLALLQASAAWTAAVKAGGGVATPQAGQEASGLPLPPVRLPVLRDRSTHVLTDSRIAFVIDDPSLPIPVYHSLVSRARVLPRTLASGTGAPVTGPQDAAALSILMPVSDSTVLERRMRRLHHGGASDGASSPLPVPVPAIMPLEEAIRGPSSSSTKGASTAASALVPGRSEALYSMRELDGHRALRARVPQLGRRASSITSADGLGLGSPVSSGVTSPGGGSSRMERGDSMFDDDDDEHLTSAAVHVQQHVICFVPHGMAIRGYGLVAPGTSGWSLTHDGSRSLVGKPLLPSTLVQARVASGAELLPSVLAAPYAMSFAYRFKRSISASTAITAKFSLECDADLAVGADGVPCETFEAVAFAANTGASAAGVALEAAGGSPVAKERARIVFFDDAVLAIRQ